MTGCNFSEQGQSDTFSDVTNCNIGLGVQHFGLLYILHQSKTHTVDIVDKANFLEGLKQKHGC